MVKWLAAATVGIWLLATNAGGALVGASVASSVFVIGLLVIIAVNVQPHSSSETPRRDPDADPDADLFEEFDDPYAEGLVDAEPSADGADETPAGRTPVRVNPRRKSRT